MPVQFYANLLVALNGALQADTIGLSLVTTVGKDDELTVTSALPAKGMEFDPREYIGTDRTVDVAMIYGVFPRSHVERSAAALLADTPSGTLASWRANVVRVEFLKPQDGHAASVRFTLRRNRKG